MNPPTVATRRVLWKGVQKRTPRRLPVVLKEAHVWYARLNPAVACSGEAFSTLSGDEQLRANCFRRERDRERYIFAHGVLRMILASYCGVVAQDLVFTRAAQGKPALAESCGGETVWFSLAHSGDRVACAVAGAPGVGVDLEEVVPEFAREGPAAQFLSQRELSRLRSLPEGLREEMFFRWWTRKEAIVKAMGAGLSYPVRNIDVSGEPCERVTVPVDPAEPDRPATWSLFSLREDPGSVGTVALEGEGWSITHVMVDCDDPAQHNFVPHQGETT